MSDFQFLKTKRPNVSCEVSCKVTARVGTTAQCHSSNGCRKGVYLRWQKFLELQLMLAIKKRVHVCMCVCRPRPKHMWMFVYIIIMWGSDICPLDHCAPIAPPLRAAPPPPPPPHPPPL